MASNISEEEIKKEEKYRKENEKKEKKIEKIEDSEVIYGIVGGEEDETKSKEC